MFASVSSLSPVADGPPDLQAAVILRQKEIHTYVCIHVYASIYLLLVHVNVYIDYLPVGLSISLFTFHLILLFVLVFVLRFIHVHTSI